jgi:hypothetical protein
LDLGDATELDFEGLAALFHGGAERVEFGA